MDTCKLCGNPPSKSYAKVRNPGTNFICHKCLTGEPYKAYKSGETFKFIQEEERIERVVIQRVRM